MSASSSSSSSAPRSYTVSRAEKLLNFKIALCESLAITYEESAFEDGIKPVESSDAVLASSSSEYKVELDTSIAARLAELEKLMDRVRSARQLYRKADVNYAALSTAALTASFCCDRCKNRNSDNIIVKHGDTICLGSDRRGCGQVLNDHYIDQGNAKRLFEDDEEDKRYYGPKPDILMPDSWNMRTTLSTKRDGKVDAQFLSLVRANEALELNIANIHHDDRRTREEYKNQQKVNAYAKMQNLQHSLHMHPAVIGRARAEFYSFRDIKEKLEKYEGIVAACLAIAFEELSQLDVYAVDANGQIVTEVIEYRKLLDDSAERQSISQVLAPKCDPSDAAVATLERIPMNRWTEVEVRVWTSSVCAGALANDEKAVYVDAVVAHVEAELVKQQSSGSDQSAAASSSSSVGVKRKLPDSVPKIFGTTTMAGRSKLAQGVRAGQSAHTVQTALGAVAPLLSAGQLLAKANFQEILRGVARPSRSVAVALLRDARARRTRYEVKCRDAAYHESKEVVRSAVENTHYDPAQAFERVKSHAVKEGYNDSSGAAAAAENGGLESILESLVPVAMAERPAAVKNEMIEEVPVKEEPAAKKPKVKIAFE